jgi:hypothetical protein
MRDGPDLSRFWFRDAGQAPAKIEIAAAPSQNTMPRSARQAQ